MRKRSEVERILDGYEIKESRVGQGHFAVFPSLAQLKAYTLLYDYFDECPLADYDGFSNAFYLGHLQ